MGHFSGRCSSCHDGTGSAQDGRALHCSRRGSRQGHPVSPGRFCVYNIGIFRLSDELLQALPWPVAYPAARALATDLPTAKRIDWALFTVQQVLRTIALTQVAAYLTQKEINDDEINFHLGRLYVPSFHDWLTLARRACERMIELGIPGPFAEEADEALADLEKRRQVAAFAPPGTENSLRGGQITTLLWLRNRFTAAHDAPIDDRENVEPMLAYALERMDEVVGRCAFLSNAHLWSQEESGFLLLRGTVPKFFSTCALPHELFRTSPIALDHAGRSVPLFPFFVRFHETGEDYACRTLDGHIPHRRNTYLSAGFGRKLDVEDHSVVVLDHLLQAKRVSVRHLAGRQSSEELQRRAWARTLQRLEHMLGTRYVPATYVERDAADDGVSRFIASRQTALLVCGASGSGKTSLLCRLVERLLRDEGATDRVVLFLSGAELQRPERATVGLLDLLRETLGLFEAMSLEDVVNQLFDARRTSNRGHRVREVWIVIDALNEAMFSELACNQVTDFARLAFLKNVADAKPWLRVVAGIRVDVLERIRARVPETLTGLAFGKGVHDVQLAPFDEPCSRLAFERAQVDAARRGFAASFRWEELAPHLQRQLRHPLLLHLFFEAVQRTDDVKAAESHGGLFQLLFRSLTRHDGGAMRTLLRHLEEGLSHPGAHPLEPTVLKDLPIDEHGVPPLQAGLASKLLTRGGDGLTFHVTHDLAAEELVRRGLNTAAGNVMEDQALLSTDPIFAGGLRAFLADRAFDGDVSGLIRLALLDRAACVLAVRRMGLETIFRSVDDALVRVVALLAPVRGAQATVLAEGLLTIDDDAHCFGGAIDTRMAALEGAVRLAKSGALDGERGAQLVSAKATLRMGLLQAEQGQLALALRMFRKSVEACVYAAICASGHVDVSAVLPFLSDLRKAFSGSIARGADSTSRYGVDRSIANIFMNDQAEPLRRREAACAVGRSVGNQFVALVSPDEEALSFAVEPLLAASLQLSKDSWPTRARVLRETALILLRSLADRPADPALRSSRRMRALVLSAELGLAERDETLSALADLTSTMADANDVAPHEVEAMLATLADFAKVAKVADDGVLRDEIGVRRRDLLRILFDRRGSLADLAALRDDLAAAASSHERDGRFDLSQPLLEEGLQFSRRLLLRREGWLDDLHWHSRLLESLGVSRHELGDGEGARQLAAERQQVDRIIAERCSGDDSRLWDVARRGWKLGRWDLRRGRAELAASAFEESLQTARICTAKGAAWPHTVTRLLVQLGDARLESGEEGAADDAYREALAPELLHPDSDEHAFEVARIFARARDRTGLDYVELATTEAFRRDPPRAFHAFIHEARGCARDGARRAAERIWREALRRVDEHAGGAGLTAVLEDLHAGFEPSALGAARGDDFEVPAWTLAP